MADSVEDIRPRRRRGEVQGMLMAFLVAQPPTKRYTAYALAKEIGVAPGTAHVAAKALVRDRFITQYGESPFIVGMNAPTTAPHEQVSE